MNEKTKRKKDSRKRDGEKAEKPNAEKKDEQGNWSDDQREKSYYYDDAHGYEIYNPDEDDD